MGKWAIEVPQELGSSCRLHGRIPAGATGQPTPGPPLAHAAAAGAKKSVLPWYRQTKDWVAYYTSFAFWEQTLPNRWGSESFLPHHGIRFGPEGGWKRYRLLSL